MNLIILKRNICKRVSNNIFSMECSKDLLICSHGCNAYGKNHLVGRSCWWWGHRYSCLFAYAAHNWIGLLDIITKYRFLPVKNYSLKPFKNHYSTTYTCTLKIQFLISMEMERHLFLTSQLRQCNHGLFYHGFKRQLEFQKNVLISLTSLQLF